MYARNVALAGLLLFGAVVQSSPFGNFLDWKRRHNKQYRTRDEEMHRFAVWEQVGARECNREHARRCVMN